MKKLTPVLLALALLCACAPQGGRSSSGPAATPTPTPGKTFVFTRENFPRLDGSTATVPLGEAIASVLLGESRENVADLIHFSKTTGAYNALMAGEADLLVVAEAGEATYAQRDEQGLEWSQEPIATEALVFMVNADNPVDSLTVEEIQAAEKVIASLEPHPGQAFQPAEPTVYVRPDIFIVELDGQLQAVLNEYYLPRVSISDYYARLLKESDEQETREYLRQKMQQAKWLLNSLERRGSTLRACADAILEAQRPFFAGETNELSPMSLSSLAEALGVHPSTISRATRGKFLQCRQGTYPLRYFFSRAIGDQGPSQQAVKRKLLELVRGEDPQRPFSDQRLCQLLSAQGIQVARRTVAKYRIELGIQSSTARKR